MATSVNTQESERANQTQRESQRSISTGVNQITQANIDANSLRVSDVIHRLTFSSETVKRLSSDDFDLGSKELVGLKYDDCILVLFHVENTESYQLANIWAIAAQQIAGPIFAAINMLNERKVAEAFTRLKSEGSHPLHWASLRQYPFIMVYRKKWPVAVYNGPREAQALIDYALTLACEAGYYEILQTGGSMQGESRIEMGPYDLYTNIPGQPPKIRKDSLQYNAENPIRGFNPNIPIVVTGSTGAQHAVGVIRSEEARSEQTASVGTLSSSTDQRPALERITGEPTVPGPAQPRPIQGPTQFIQPMPGPAQPILRPAQPILRPAESTQPIPRPSQPTQPGQGFTQPNQGQTQFRQQFPTIAVPAGNNR